MFSSVSSRRLTTTLSPRSIRPNQSIQRRKTLPAPRGLQVVTDVMEANLCLDGEVLLAVRPRQSLLLTSA